jgi:hypothetical protein
MDNQFDRTILGDLQAMIWLAEERKRIDAAQTACRLCLPGDPCWWHRPFVPRVTGVASS